jgi:hypothetical protein
MQAVEAQTIEENQAIKEPSPFLLFRVNGRKLLLAAAIFHALITCSVYAAGRFHVLPNLLNADGILIASDSEAYMGYLQDSREKFQQEGLSDWLAYPIGVHIRLYTPCYLLFSGIFGKNIISLEPLNLLCYLAILALIFKLGKEIFDRRVGVLAATIIGLWPAFLLHTTQIFRDPLYIAALLLMIWIVIDWLNNHFSWRQSLAVTATGILTVIGLLLTRENMWELSLGILVLGLLFLLFRQVIERRLFPANLIAAIVIIVFAFGLPHDFKRGHVKDYWFVSLLKGNSVQGYDQDAIQQARDDLPQNDIAMPDETMDAAEQNKQFQEQAAARESEEKSQVDKTSYWVMIPWRLWVSRHRIANGYGYTDSVIDPDVEFKNFWDVIRYTPRALSIGLFAPFPNMWLTTGSMGKSARVVSGLETLLMYIIEALAVFAVWRARKRLAVWYLVAVALVGVTLQAMVVANLGALYRMRYAFWMIIIILGVQGLITLFASRKAAMKLTKADA